MTLDEVLAAAVQAVVGGSVLVACTALALRCARISAARRGDIWFGVLIAIALLPMLDRAARLVPHPHASGIAPTGLHEATILANVHVLVLVALALGLTAFGALGMVGLSYVGLARLRGRTHGAPDFVRADAEAAARTIGFRGAFEVRIGTASHSPLSLGVRRPTIVLPTSALALARRERELVVMHELAHLQRYDPLINMATRTLLALAVYNPAAFLAARAIGRDRELACDDVVMVATDERRAYARAIARYLGVELRLPAAVLGLLAQPAFALKRMEHVLTGGRAASPSRARRIALSACACAMAAVLFLWSDASPLVRFVFPATPQMQPLALSSGPLRRLAPAIGTLSFAAGTPSRPAAVRFESLAIPRLGTSLGRVDTRGPVLTEPTLPAPTVRVRYASIASTDATTTTFARPRGIVLRNLTEVIGDTGTPDRAPRSQAAIVADARPQAGNRAFVASFARHENFRPPAVSFGLSIGGTETSAAAIAVASTIPAAGSHTSALSASAGKAIVAGFRRK